MYSRILRWLWNTSLWIELAFNKIFTNKLNPFYYHGALPNVFLWVLIVTGVFLLFHYIPTTDRAFRELQYLTTTVPFGGLIRAIHRYAADGMLIAVFIHSFRCWFTDRYRGYRVLEWLSGVALLVLVYWIGITGYQLIWDDRSLLLTKLTLDMFNSIDRIPLLGVLGIGTWLVRFILGGEGISDITIARYLTFHYGLALIVLAVLVLHYVRITKPKTWMPPALWLLFTGIVLLISGAFPVITEKVSEARTFADPKSLNVDILYLWPYMVFNALGPSGTFLVTLGLVFVIAGIPYFIKTYRPYAYVIDDLCVGCKLCEVDCPYFAIEMIEKPPEATGKKPRLLAIVNPARCTECGICVGSCAFDAIEIPKINSGDIRTRIKELWQTES